MGRNFSNEAAVRLWEESLPEYIRLNINKTRNLPQETDCMFDCCLDALAMELAVGQRCHHISEDEARYLRRKYIFKHYL